MRKGHSEDHVTAPLWAANQLSLYCPHNGIRGRRKELTGVSMRRRQRWGWLFTAGLFTDTWSALCQCSTEFTSVLQSLPVFYTVYHCSVEFTCVLQSLPVFYRTLQHSTELTSVLQSLSDFYKVAWIPKWLLVSRAIKMALLVSNSILQCFLISIFLIQSWTVQGVGNILYISVYLIHEPQHMKNKSNEKNAMMLYTSSNADCCAE